MYMHDPDINCMSPPLTQSVAGDQVLRMVDTSG